jgi:hypothetical protein
MRKAKDTDFFIPLPGVGTFRFGRRTFGDRAKIRAEIMRLTREFEDLKPVHEEPEDPENPSKQSQDYNELSAYASIMATHKFMCVEAPEGWEDIENMELTDENDTKIFELYGLVRAKEESFRSGAKAGSQAPGQGISDDLSVLVQAEVQPSAD